MKPRLILAAGLTFVSVLGWCDRLVTVPLSVKVPFETWKIEYLRIPSDDRSNTWLSYGLSKKIEVELAYDSLNASDKGTTGSIAYQLLPSIEDVTPGLTFGIQDLSNFTKRGRAAYAAFTYRISNDGDYNQDVPTEFTFGLWTASRGLVYFGFSLPITNDFRIIGEHDGKELTAGLDIRGGRGFGAKVVTVESHLGLSVSWQGKF